MRADAMVQAYCDVLSAAADPQRAQAMAAYQRGQFAFYGIPTPQRRAITREVQKQALRRLNHTEWLQLADLLWQQDQREYQYAACDLLIAASCHLPATALPMLEKLISQKSWWDSVDLLASRVVGMMVLRERSLQARMDALASHPNLWLRRSAILHQLHWKSETDAQRLLAYCLSNASDKDFFIRKAIGWALRQYARSEPTRVSQWIVHYQSEFAPLSLREASKHLNITLR